jgi:hypothetical protein
MIRVGGMFPKDRYFAPPSFESWAVKRGYGLELKVTVGCLGEKSEFKVKWINVVLFAARMEDGLEEAIGEIERGLPGYEEELPSYGHVINGGAA